MVSNYASAHDTNGNLVIERYINENGDLLQSKEMIWYEGPRAGEARALAGDRPIRASASGCRNYHCWVEGWMTRPDLRPEFNGWQASDPTPQEKSEGNTNATRRRGGGGGGRSDEGSVR